MSPMKLSLYGPEDGFEEHVELDDDLASRLRQTVDAHPDLTVGEAIRQGIEHVVEHGPAGRERHRR
jgi:hypothetical protein